MNEQEAIAAIRVVGAVARADGKVSEEEKIAFRQAVAEFNPKLPDGTDVEKLLGEESDLDADLAAIKSPVMRKAVFDTAVAMSLVDGESSSDENKVLARVRSAFAESTTGEPSLLERALKMREQMDGGEPVLDPATRTQRVRDLISRRALWASVFGAIPIPLVSDVGVLVQIDLLVGGVSMVWGHPLTRKERFARFGAVISLAMAQSAIHSLFKLIPGWGSVAGAVGGGVTAFVVTHAIGSVVNYHFEKEGKTTAAELKQVFKTQKTEAKSEYESKKSEIEAMRAKHADELATLSAKLEKKEITQEEFNAKLAELSSKV